MYFLGFTLCCTCNRKGNFRVGLRTEKSRLRRALMHAQDLMRRMRHLPIREQADHLNRVLRGHYAYYGIAGNIRALQRVHRAVERYWRKGTPTAAVSPLLLGRPRSRLRITAPVPGCAASCYCAHT